MEEYLLRKEHEEFARRMDTENQRLAEEDRRQNARIANLEDNIKEIHKLNISVERMADRMENMLEAIKQQGNLLEKQTNRINEMEDAPAKDLKKYKETAVIAMISTVAGALAIGLVFLIAQFIK